MKTKSGKILGFRFEDTSYYEEIDIVSSKESAIASTIYHIKRSDDATLLTGNNKFEVEETTDSFFVTVSLD